MIYVFDHRISLPQSNIKLYKDILQLAFTLLRPTTALRELSPHPTARRTVPLSDNRHSMVYVYTEFKISAGVFPAGMLSTEDQLNIQSYEF